MHHKLMQTTTIHPNSTIRSSNPERGCVQRTNRSGKRLLYIALLLSIAFIITPARAADPVSKEYLQDLYINYLREEGYRAELDSTNRIKFKYEGRPYYLCVTEDDPEFFKVFLPVGCKTDTETEKNKALEAASFVMRRMKSVKICPITDDQVWISIELFFAQPGDFKPLFGRTLRVLQTSYDSFCKRLSEKPSGSASQGADEQKKNSGEARPSATFVPAPLRVPQLSGPLSA